jgi:WD repeat-containing protein 35
MLQTGDLEGLQFLNKIKNIEDDELKKAEILEFNNNYDEASNKYKNMGRNDLNLAMNIKLGKWDKVTDMMSKNDEKDENLKIAYNNYADELFEKKDYDKAEEYYKKSGNLHGLVNTYFAKEEYNKASDMIDIIPKEDEFLEKMGDKFKGLGMCEEAVKAYSKRGNLKKAMETYIENNKWGEAVELSRENDFYNMEQLTNKFGNEFIKNGRKLDLVELFNKANMKLKVNKYLSEIAYDMRKLRANPLIIKKIYVLAALELENYKKRISDSQINNEEHQDNNNDIKIKNKDNENKIINNKYTTKDIDKILFNSWKGAEAFHYYMLCQHQLYNRKFKEACKTSIRLTLYEKELGSEDVYRLIALCSYLNKSFNICSNALSTLEKLNTIDKFRQKKYEELAKSIFVKYEPKNVDEKFFKCPNNECKQPVSEFDIYCKNCGMNFNGCVLTGGSILDHHYFKCKQCHHRTKKSEVKKSTIANCPFCHCSLGRK